MLERIFDHRISAVIQYKKNKMKGKVIEVRSSNLGVVRLPGKKGRCVCALRNICKGDLIEQAPVLVIPKKEKALIERTVLWDHWISWGHKDQDLAIPLGFGGLYNHSYEPNAICYAFQRQRKLEYVALRDIKSGEEITINYNGSPDDKSPVWFDYDS